MVLIAPWFGGFWGDGFKPAQGWFDRAEVGVLVGGGGSLVGERVVVGGIDAAPVVHREVGDVDPGALRVQRHAGGGVYVDVVVLDVKAIPGVMKQIDLSGAVHGQIDVLRDDGAYQTLWRRLVGWKRDLAAHQAHSYSIALTAGQYVRLIIHQRGIAVEVTLFDPDGKQLSKVFSHSQTREPELVSIIAEITGNYRLEVRSTKTAGAGSYGLKIEDLRKATGQDKSRIEAEQTLMQAELLHGQGTVESLESAILTYEKAALLSRAAEDSISEARMLNNIGELYDSLGEKQKALKYFAQVLPIRRALNDREGEARTELRISQVYKELGEIQKALDSLEIALQLSRATGDLVSEAIVFTALGNHYVSLGDSRKALDFYTRAVTLWRAAGDRAGEARALGGLAKACIFQFQTRKALSYHKQALALRRLLGDRGGELRVPEHRRVFEDLDQLRGLAEQHLRVPAVRPRHRLPAGAPSLQGGGPGG